MAGNVPILYSYFRSSCSWRVRIALAIKNIKYEYKPINLLTKEQLTEEYAKINPLLQVPAFVDNGNVLTESLPIIEYLEETRPGNPLYPSDPVLKAKVRSISECIAAGIQPLQNLNVLMMVGDDKLKWAQHWIENGFRKLEKVLEPIHGKCCVQDTVTVADLVLVPQVYNATQRFEVDMKKFPIISKINDHLLTLEPFKVSHPTVQPDFPN